MNFWDRVSRLLEDLPHEDRIFTENTWSAFSKLSVQLWADTTNAMASISPNDIPIYDIRYWQKFVKDGTWDVPTGVYSIPKLQELVFAETTTEYVEGTDYNITGADPNRVITWVGGEPASGYAWAERVLYYNGYLDTKQCYDLRFNGINTAGYTPIHAHHLARALNYAYRSTDTEFALKVGITAILGLPFTYVAGIIKSKSTASGNHTVVITDGNGDDHDIVIDSGLCDLTDFPDVGTTVLEFEPLIADAIKVGKNTSQSFMPKVDSTYPTDGDMELTGTVNWTAINSGVLSKNTTDEYEGDKCLKVIANVIGRGVKPAADQTVVANDEYVYEFYIKSRTDYESVVKVDVKDISNTALITSEWFGDTNYEHGFIRFTAPAGCVLVNIEFTTIEAGTFFLDNLDLFEVKELTSYAADKTANSVKASYTLSDRGSTVDLVFSAADHIYGTNGNYVQFRIINGSALSSTISGSGTSGDPYQYSLTCGNAGESSNNAIVAFVNSDPNALTIIQASSADDSADDNDYSKAWEYLVGGIDAKISTYEAVFYITGDTIDIRNLTRGTKETKKITGVASGSAPYSKILSLDGDLFAEYISPETGTSTDVGAGYLEDTSKSWITNEHQGDVLIDSADTSFKIASNDSDTLTITGTPASGAYRIVKDHVGVIFGERAADHADIIKIYNRWTTTYDQDNVDAYIDNIGDQGHKLEFKDVS